MYKVFGGSNGSPQASPGARARLQTAAGSGPLKPARAVLIGLDLCHPGISTDSARGPETTGNNRHVPGNADTRTGRPLPSPAARLPCTGPVKPQVRLADRQAGEGA